MFSHSDINNGTRTGKDETYLLKNAMHAFVSKGYTKTDLEEIANACGMSLNLLQAGFEDKEALFEELVFNSFDLDRILSDCDNLCEMLVVLIEELKDAAREKNDFYRFLRLFLYDRDVPENIREGFGEACKDTSLYAEMLKAQMSGNISSGDCLEILIRFVKASISIMEGYISAGFKIPDNEFFFNIVQYVDEDTIPMEPDIVKQQNSIIAAFVSDFHSILFVDLDEDTIEIYRTDNGDDRSDLEDLTGFGFRQFVKLYADRYIFPEDRDWFINQMNPDNLIEKLDADPVFYMNHRVNGNGRTLYYQTEIVLDPMYSAGNKILIGSHRVYDDVKRVSAPNTSANEKKNNAVC